VLASLAPTVLSKTKPEVPKDQTDEGRREQHFFPGGVTESRLIAAKPDRIVWGTDRLHPANQRPEVTRGLRRKPAAKRMLICGNCGAEFMSSRSDAKWCSRSCQAYARVAGQSASRTAAAPAAKPDGS
jgi:hypothetical protein